jgi:hypothetical protein
VFNLQLAIRVITPLLDKAIKQREPSLNCMSTLGSLPFQFDSGAMSIFGPTDSPIAAVLNRSLALCGSLDPLMTTASVACAVIRFNTMNSYRTLIASLLVLLFFGPGTVAPQEAIEVKPAQDEQPSKQEQRREKSSKQEQSGKVLQDTMTAEEFKAAGLEKLSAEELKNLNDWLQGYRRTTETKAAEKATVEATKKAGAQSRAKMDLIVSRVDGTFTGLTGHTVIKLEDGTVWKQAMVDDRYRAQITDHPGAAVMHGVFGYKMRIAGMPEFYVDPVRK